MDMLQLHTEEIPEYEGLGARYVVVAHYGEWRDGEVTNDPKRIPALEQKLRKRFMNRFNRQAA